MTRLVLILSSLLFALSASASHIHGGEISYECLGGGQYEFTLIIYHDCTSTAMPATEQLTGPQGVINLTHQITGNFLPQCYDASITGCDSVLVSVGLQRSIYIGTTTLSGNPGSAGWEFSWSACCRPGQSNISTAAGFVFRAMMYHDPAGSCSETARWESVIPALNLGQHKLRNAAVARGQGDSLFFKFVTPLIQPNVAATWQSGYSATAPFPDQSEDPANGPVVLNSATGTITTDINVVPSQFIRYQYALEVECWRGGNLIGTSMRDLTAIFSQMAFGNNNAPNSAIDTAVWNLTPPPGEMVLDNLGVYHVLVYPGDQLKFELSGQDFDYNTTSGGGLIPQNIIFSASGYALDSNLNSFMSRPRITPKAPQSTFSKALNNNVIFEWDIMQEHVTGRSTSYLFYFTFRDNACPLALESELNMEVVVMDTSATVGQGEIATTGYQLYPNPASSTFRISGLEGNQIVEIADVSGKIVRRLSIGNNEQVDVSDLKAGLYLVMTDAQSMLLRVE